MSFATSQSTLSSIPRTSPELLGKVTDNYQNPYFPKLTRFVHGNNNKKPGMNGKQYKMFFTSLLNADSLTGLAEDVDKDGLFCKVHVPVRHKLVYNRFSLTLEDLRNRLANMDIRYPLCVVGTENHNGSRLNMIKSMEDRVDGVDYVMLVFVPAGLVSLYKNQWPNQIIVEIPFTKVEENIRDITRQVIKCFGATLGTDYVFVCEDDVVAAYRATGGEVNPISMYEFLNELQNTDSEGFPIVGARTATLQENITQGTGVWANNTVSGIFLLKTDVDANFSKVKQNEKIDTGLTKFQQDANSEGLIQQSQTLVLRRGYTTFDPVGSEGSHTLFQRVKYKQVVNIEPEQNNVDLRVKVISNKIAIQKTLADGTEYIRSFAIVGDETASVLLIGKQDQVALLQKDSILDIRGAKVVMFNGFIRLSVDRGMIIPSPNQTDFEPNTNENVSTSEYELVG